MKRSGLTVDSFRAQRMQIEDRHRNGEGGIRVALSLTTLHDELLRFAYEAVPTRERSGLAIIALGGYGRRELCFASDIDIMLLVASRGSSNAHAAETYLHRLLDYGLNIGHSVRTIDECLAIARDDLESRMSLLESRLVVGSSRLHANYRRALDGFLRLQDHAEFARRLFDLLDRRHTKYGNSTTLLEPNIKNSAGGLRDLHTAYWLLRGTGALAASSARASNEPATISMLRTKTVRRLLRPDHLQAARHALDFILRARNELHVRSGTLNDLMAFGLQPTIATGLRIRATGRRSTVEQFMQQYYVASRSIALVASRLRAWATDRWMRPESWTAHRPLDALFEVRHAHITLRKPVRQLTNEQALRAFLYAAREQADLAFDVEDAIHRSEKGLRPVRGTDEESLWIELFSLPKPIAPTLQKMNVLGLFGRWIPEWKPLVAFFQHNQYHFYTADEHTLLVIANAEALLNADSAFGAVARSLPRFDLLRWACLLHDIAKPVQLATHEITGGPIASDLLRRLGLIGIANDVAFLVRHHLLMEQVAFRRNLNDPQAIHEFAQHFERAELLDYLYVLTYADLSAVNKNVFTEWKASLLNELYRKGHEAVESRLSRDELQVRNQQETEQLATEVRRTLGDQFPERLIENHLALIEEPSYLATFNAEEIRAHLHMVIRRPLVRAEFKHAGDVTDVTIVARDAPYALSRFCGVLSANDVNILDAGIYTRRDGIIIDRFRVADFVNHSILSAEQCQRISRELEDVFNGQTDLRHLLARHRAKWKRRSRRLNPNIRLDVDFEEHPRFTIIDVYAADTLGFLYRITESISRLGLNIAFAKIATRGDGIVDSFYVTDERGKRISESSQLTSIREALLETVRETAETELIVG